VIEGNGEEGGSIHPPWHPSIHPSTLASVHPSVNQVIMVDAVAGLSDAGGIALAASLKFAGVPKKNLYTQAPS